MPLAQDIIEILQFVVIAITASASTILFFVSKNKDREKETYDYIDNKFNDFLEMCMEKPYLDIFDTEDTNKVELTDLQKKEEKIAFAYLMSIFERVYIFYVENGKNCDIDQLENWKKTIKEYLKRKSFRTAWEENGYGWDAGFILFMDEMFLKVENKVHLKPIHTRKDFDLWYKEYDKNFIKDKNNDEKLQLLEYLNNNTKYPYQYYFINNCDDKMVGGMLTQEIKGAVIILYIFVKENRRQHGYGSYALRTLRNKYNEDTYFLAEVEKRNKRRKSWWLNNLFSEIDFKYYTPEMDEKFESEENAVNVNDLIVFLNKPVKTKKLGKVIKLYFKTSFVHDIHRNINHFESVKMNELQLSKMKNIIDVK